MNLGIKWGEEEDQAPEERSLPLVLHAHPPSWSAYYMASLRLLLLTRFNRVQLCATPTTAAHQALLSLGFSRQEYWSGFPSSSESAYHAGVLGLILGSGRSPGKGMAIHSSILTWRTPWTEEPGRLQSMGSQRVGQDWLTNTLERICIKQPAAPAAGNGKAGIRSYEEWSVFQRHLPFL